MVDLVHNFGARKHKRGASFKRATDATLEVVGKADEHPTGEGLDRQAIVVMESPKMGFHVGSGDCALNGFRRGIPDSCEGLGGHSLEADC